MKTKRRYLCAVIALVAAPSVDAADSGPTGSGFGGSLSLGGMFVGARTNMVSSTGFGLLKLGEASPNPLNGEPGTHGGILPLVTLNVKYAFADTSTQLFAGGTPANGEAVQFDYFLQGGVRQGIGGAGAVSLAYLFGLPVKVWADPYVAGTPRTETTRRTQGARLGWESVLGSPLQMQYTFRTIAIDDEGSGRSLGPSAGDAKLLQRAGNMHQGEIRYPFTFAGAHQLTPALSYTREDLQGAAMSSQAYELKLRYALGAKAFVAMFEGSIGRSVHDQRNPIFGSTQADQRYAASATLLLRSPFGWAPFGNRRWSLFGTVRYTAVDSNIDFYSAGLLAAGVGVSMEF